MTIGEAETLFKIMSKADGGCISCATSLFDDFCKEFPEFRYKINGDWYRDDNVKIELHKADIGINFTLQPLE